MATHGVVSLVDLFHATTDTLLALSSSSSSFSVDFHGAILCSMNNLIVYIGYEISSETTKKIESKLCALLYALTKGIFPAQQYSNRKIHRSNAEIIRVTPQLQQRVLQLGLSFLLHCHKLGVYSAILPILKKCAEDSLGIIENRMMGMQILTVLDTVTMPVAIALPIHNVQALIQEAIHEARTTAGTGILTDEEPLQQNGDSFIDEVVQVDTEGEKDTKNLIRQEEKEDSPSTKRVKLTAAEVETNFEVRNKVANMFGSRATNSSAVNVEKSRVLVEDNSDDDSLPDIVM